MAGKRMVFVALVFLLAVLVLPVIGRADDYVGGLPLTTVQSGTVSGGVYVDAMPAPDWGSQDVVKNFTLPDYTDIQWARLYVSAYCGHMQNNYTFLITSKFGGNGDGVYDAVWSLNGSEDRPFVYVVNGGNDNTAYGGGSHDAYAMTGNNSNRVSSDYLFWYDVASLIHSRNVSVEVNTTGSYDGRIKVITLVVAYNDGSSRVVHYWVNQGHDEDSYYPDSLYGGDVYVGETSFSGIPSGFTNATLTVNHMASSDGLYTFGGSSLPRYDSGNGDSYFLGAYSGYDVWNVTGLVSGDSAVLTYDRSGEGTGEYSGQFYKIPLAVLTVETPAGVPVAQFTANRTAGFSPLAVSFSDQSSGSITSWAWDFNGDGVVDSTLQDPVYTFSAPGNYSVNLMVSGPGGSNSKVRTGYITVNDPSPVAAFSVNRTAGISPLCVAFADESSGIVDSWAWDFNGDGVVDSTLQDPVYTYASPGNYSVNLSVSGPYGRDSLVKSGYITVSATASFDLTVSSVSTGYVFCRQNNTISVGVKNNGPDESPACVVELWSNDGFCGRAAVPALSGGSSTRISIVDTSIRPATGASVYYTAVVDPDHSLAETDESNNVAVSKNYTVIYNGYDGKRYMPGGGDITTRRVFDLQGNVSYSQGNSTYKPGSWSNYTVLWADSQPLLPAGASVVAAYLYASYTWDNMNVAGTPGMLAFTFNGQPISNVSWYADQSNFGGYASYAYGLLTYNVTSLYQPDGVNTLLVSRNDNKASAIAMYPFTLLVVYRDGNETRKQVFINEEYDLLAVSASSYYNSPDEATAFAPFTGMRVDMGNVSGATLYSFATNAGPHEGNLSFNNYTVAVLPDGAYHGNSSTSDAAVYDVTGYLKASGNVVSVQSTDSGGMGVIQQVLVVSYPVTAPVANFSGNVTSGSTPLTVAFDSGDSIGLITSYAWSFGDGGTSSERDPVYTYRAPGNYSVSLTVGGPLGCDTMSRVGYISTGYVAPVAGFSASPLSGTAPLAVVFVDASAGSVTSYAWSFGDGGSSSEQDPVYTYMAPGNYSVSLTVGGPVGNDTITKYQCVMVGYPVPVADFTSNVTSGVAPLSVSFSDASAGNVTSWAWDFNGDGVVDSTLQNPSYTYAAVGNYTVSLTVSGPGGINSTVKNDFIHATVMPPVADFLSNVTYGTAPLAVQFTDRSSNATGWQWDFDGNGVIDSTDENPCYTYYTPGNYTVRLTAIGPGGSNTTVKADYVKVSGLMYLARQLQWVPLRNPRGVAVDSHGNVYETDCDTVKVIYPNGTGRVLAGGFGYPTGVAADSKGNVYVSEYYGQTVYKIYPNGTVVAFCTGLFHPDGLAVDSMDNVYVADWGNCAVKKIYQNGSVVTLANNFNSLWDVGVDAQGNVYVDDNGEIEKILPNGRIVMLGDRFFGSSLSMAVDPQGNVYLSATGSNIYEIYQNGTVALLFSIVADRSEGLDVDSQGNLYISEGYYIYKHYPNGSKTVVDDLANYDTPWGVAYDAKGNLYVGFSGGKIAEEVFSNGSIVRSGFNGPWNVNVDAYGDKFVADTANNTVNIVYPNGSSVVAGSGYSSIVGVAVDSRGHVCVMDSYTISEYTLPGYVPAPPVANYTVNETSGVAPLTVGFSDSSSWPVDSWAWDFNGDGIVDSTLQNPVYTYTVPGNYSVSLAVSGPGGNSTMVKAGYVTVNVPAPVADFSGSPVSGFAPLTVLFNASNSSGQISSWAWDFNGDGIVDSTLQNPVYTYTVPGNYSVSLAVSGPGGNSTMVKPAYITVNVSAPVAGFTANVTSGFVPLEVQFNDTSTGSPSSWAWDFNGDGIVDSTLQSPLYTYTVPGNYSVSLVVSGPGGNNTSVKPSYISCLSSVPAPVANFTATPRSGVAPLTVQFNDTSGNSPTSWLWDFGDGNYSSAQNATHEYVVPGVYNVTLTAGNDGGNNTLVQAGYITVTVPAPVAGFSASPTSGAAPLSVSFTDASTGQVTSWAWDFNNDGVVDSTQQSPSYTYVGVGTYTVNLKVSGPGGSNSKVMTNYISVTSPPPVANFVANVTGGVMPLVVQFTDLSTNATSWSWDFNVDGKVDSTLQSPVYTYVNPGVYTVSLKVSGSGGSSSVVKVGLVNVSGLMSLTRQWVVFNYPYGVAVDGRGSVFVADSYADKVKVLFSNGTSASIGNSFTDERGVAVDSSGNVYVSDYNKKMVKEVYANGSIAVLASGLSGPRGVAVDASGNVFVADASGNVVRKIYPNGSIAVVGSGFSGPCGVAVDGSGNVFVADTKNNAVKEVYANGSIVVLSSSFNRPAGLAVDGSGNVFVADTNNNMIKEISTDGNTYVVSGGFSQPCGVAVDGSGNVFVADYGNGEVKEIYVNGSIAILGSGIVTNSHSVAYDTVGDVFVADYVSNAVKEIRTNNSVVTVASGFRPYNLGIDSLGDVYVADPSNSVIREICVNGSVLALGSGLGRPYGVAVDLSGNVFVADTGNNAVKVIYSNGTTVLLASGFSSPYDVAVDGLGNVYVADYSNNAVKKICSNGSVMSLGSGFSRPQGLAADSAGNVFVADTSNNAVKEILLNGSVVILRSDFNSPYDVALDGMGRVCVVDNNAISEFALPVSIPSAPVAGFTANVTSGVAPLEVQFNDTSTGSPSSWQWDFGDGTANSSEQSPVHAYDRAGTYTVTLSVNGSGGSSTLQKEGYVVVSPATPFTGAEVIGYAIPDSMAGGEPYAVSVTVRNTGLLPWNESSMFRLGMVGDESGDAYLFNGITARAWLPSGANVLPGESVTFNFTMTAPVAVGVYHPSYRMVWEGHEWFGDVLNVSVNVTAPLANASIVGCVMPGVVVAGMPYNVSVTVRNTGLFSWNESSMFRLGMVGDDAGDAYRLNGTTARVWLPSGVEVAPGDSYTFNFSLNARVTPGSYQPAYRMVWEGHEWFGDVLNTLVNVSGPDAVVTGDTIPSTMSAGQAYNVSVTVQNTGSLSWNESSMFRLGMVGDEAGDAYLFNGVTARVWLPDGAEVLPGESVTFNYTMTAPAAGTYHPSFRMVWENHEWFGQAQAKTVTVS